MLKILIVEDSASILMVLQTLLTPKYSLTISTSIEEARQKLSTMTFDLLLLDINLPDGDGLKFFAGVKNDYNLSDIPVLFLTGKEEVEEKILAFSLGADDYIMKPFNSLELRARIELRLNKAQKSKSQEDNFVKGDLRFNLSQQKIYLLAQGEKILDLTPHEYRLLVYFAKHENHVCSRNAILDSVWGSEVHISDRTVDSHISKLRHKISESQFHIKSVHSVGYIFENTVDLKRAS
jgi:DNA-binding response OmpR family regulator